MKLPSDLASTRQYASALSVLGVALFIGLPVWWKTTEVYRCPLPYKEIMNLQNQQVPSEIAITISVVGLGCGDVSGFVGQLQSQLVEGSVVARNVRIRTRYIVKTTQLESSEAESLLSAASSMPIENFSQLIDDHLPSSLGQYSLVLIGSELAENGPIKSQISRAFVSHNRHSIMKFDSQDYSDCLTAALKVVRGLYGERTQLEKTLQNIPGLQFVKVDVDSMRQLRASQGYQLSFTLLNPDPSTMSVSWNIQHATDSILLPFLRHPGMASLGNYTVSSQVFYYTDVKFRPRANKNAPGYHILSSQLPPMISSVESKLGSLVSQLPSLNFLVYLPRRNEVPLTIKSSSLSEQQTDSFLVPQWGGVVFHNYNLTSDSVVVEMDDVMPMFVQQLKSLLGISQQIPQIANSNTIKVSHGPLSITDWQIDHLLVAKMVESVSMATTSLISLVSLLDKVKNMVISDHIQTEVEASLANIQKCFQLTSDGDLANAYILAKQAMHSAETAFFDPSILELLYFPDDQKFAIYIPLFLPISVPILLSSLAAVKWLRSRRKSDQDKPKTD